MTNIVLLTGQLTDRPLELRQTNAGTPYTRVSMKTERKQVDNNTGQMQNFVTWHTLYAYKEVAEAIALRSLPLDHVSIRGELRSRKVTNSNDPNAREHFVQVFEFDNYTRPVYPEAAPQQQVQQQAAQQQAPQQQPVHQQPAQQPAPQHPAPQQQPVHQQPANQHGPQPAYADQEQQQNGGQPAGAGTDPGDLPF